MNNGTKLKRINRFITGKFFMLLFKKYGHANAHPDRNRNIDRDTKKKNLVFIGCMNILWLEFPIFVQ